MAPTTQQHQRLWPRRLIRSLHESDAGQSLVEFSMILPIFLILLFALVDFGRGFYTWMVITNAAREGARAAAVQSDLATVDSKIYGSFCASYPSDCSISTDPTIMTITPTNIQGTPGTDTSIDISYNFQFVTPLGSMLTLIGGSSISAPTLQAHATMRLE
jgi:Flp pilus assembly protein TadG